ncbi:DNA-binding protein [Micromonospora matsumotoense]|uniref:helix-turn-helix transcriptional regulator n=1 Tax=Micromonospora matsumotoense TaxID=121616 RepID=UPI003444B6E6
MALLRGTQLEVWGAAEIQERLGVSRQRTYILISRRDFPPPAAVLKMGQIWLKSDVEAWIVEKRPHLLEVNEKP